MITESTTNYLEELTHFLTADSWSEERIMELLTNVYLMGYNEAKVGE